MYLLDLVAHAFAEPPLFVQNLTAVHFETDDATSVGDEIRPRIKSVKLEGDWVGDSPQACQLLVAKRTLVGVSFLARFAPQPDETHFLPVRINVSRDHVHVLTAFGKESEPHAEAAHRVIVQRAVDSLTNLFDQQRTIEAHAARVERAHAEGPVGVDLLSQPAKVDSPANPV